ncbi:MAG: type-F conjugative transfer system secretin TraK [Gammaproteobacteria bacterium]|nr:type-F conjugative transfer system secretin TraK [Gammaproteobacteria bacterium]
MTTNSWRRRRAGSLDAAFLVSLFAVVAAAESTAGTRILDAADHAELAAEISADSVVRVALLGDRIERVIRLPGEGFSVEHDPMAGDLYLHPVAQPATPQVSGAPQLSVAPQGPAAPQALFIGSETGSTYRLNLIPVPGGPSQILVRNADLETADRAAPVLETGRVVGIAGLLRAAAGGEPSPNYRVETADQDSAADMDIVPVEVWRGPRFEALVLALGVGAPVDASDLAAALGPDVVAVWIPEHGARRHVAESLAVAVREARAQ